MRIPDENSQAKRGVAAESRRSAPEPPPSRAENSQQEFSSGVLWARWGAGIAGLVSVLANVAHTYLAPAGTPDGWTPGAGAVIASIWWPVALFMTIEVLVRARWPHGWQWWVLRIVSTAPVAVVAGIISYLHLSALLVHYGEVWWVAHVAPFGIDGMLLACTGALLASRMSMLAERAEHVDEHQDEHQDEHAATVLSAVPDEPPAQPVEHEGEPAAQRPERTAQERPIRTGHRRTVAAASKSRADVASAGVFPCVPGCVVPDCSGQVSRATLTRHRARAREAAVVG